MTTFGMAGPDMRRPAPRRMAFTLNRKEVLIMGRHRRRRHSHRHSVGHGMFRIVEHVMRHLARAMG